MEQQAILGSLAGAHDALLKGELSVSAGGGFSAPRPEARGGGFSPLSLPHPLPHSQAVPRASPWMSTNLERWSSKPCSPLLRRETQKCSLIITFPNIVLKRMCTRFIHQPGGFSSKNTPELTHGKPCVTPVSFLSLSYSTFSNAGWRKTSLWDRSPSLSHPDGGAQGPHSFKGQTNSDLPAILRIAF